MTQIYIKDSNKYVLDKMQKAGFNVTTCGHCGAIRLHEIPKDELDCESCGMESDVCDFPDLYVV